MKKLALAFCLLAVSFTAQAQFEKGTMIPVSYTHLTLPTKLEV